MEHPWLFDRCREVQNSPNGHLDLWARDHRKSTIITFGQTIQDILSSHGDNPLPKWNGREVTIGIFSHTRPIAKKFLRQIQYELENNTYLIDLFPDVLWSNPGKDAPAWSLDTGIIVNRKSNPKEATVEAWGLVDGQPIGVHFYGRVYDDVVTKASTNSPDMIMKTTEAWELSQDLGTEGGYERYIGTRYHFNDTYKTMMDRKSAVPRLYPATEDGTAEGDPVLLSKAMLSKKRRDQGPYTFSCQQLLNPVADSSQGFSRDWLKYWKGGNTKGMNIYILVDPASEKKKSSDYTAIWVVGLGQDKNYYVIDCIRDRLNLTERTRILFELHRKYSPKDIGYEKYGMQADIEHIKSKQEDDNYRFNITELGGSVAKNDRIKRLVPVFEQGNMYLLETCFRTDYNKKIQDLTQVFIEEEYAAFPVPIHDDMLDSLARIKDPNFKTDWPIESNFSKPLEYSNQGIL